MEYPWLKDSPKEDMVHEFTVDFTGEFIIAGEKRFPLGHFTTEILNLPVETATELWKISDEFKTVFAEKFMQTKENPALLSEIQESLNRVFDIIFEIPLYRELDFDRDFTKRFMLHHRDAEPENWEQIYAAQPNYNSTIFFDLIGRVTDIGRSILGFKQYVELICNDYFEPLTSRSPKSYAEALGKFNSDSNMLNSFSGMMLFGLSPWSKVMFEHLPVEAADGGFVLAERTVFEHYGDFLRTDFFRAVKSGNAPRCCHHCGKYFLLTAGYNICYCNNIAPDQAKRTCRQIGTHRKRSGHVGRTPIQAAYEKAYTRLKTRKSRGKISVSEWNTAVAKAQDIKDAVERGDMQEFDGVRVLGEI